MSKPNKPAGAVVSANNVRPGSQPGPVEDTVKALVAQNPEAISFDIVEPDNEMLWLQCQTDPGVPAQMRDGFRGRVNVWAVTPWQAADESTGELLTLPSLYLKTVDGRSIRLTGWPVVSAWSQILRAAGPDRVRAGLDVVVKRRQSGTAGRSYWTVLPDSGCPSAPGSY